MKESDLYLPLKQFLENQNYEVKAEIHGCDVMALRNDELPVIVELKLTLNLDVILQAVDRIKLSPNVYIGVPTQCKSLKRKKKQIIKLLKMLSLGLIVIGLKSVKILLDPTEYTPRQSKFRQQRLLGEFVKRVGDPNLGGSSSKHGVVTAYKQQAIAIAQYLKDHGASKASDISEVLANPKARGILYRDVYGWFDRKGHGIYELSPRGLKEMS